MNTAKIAALYAQVAPSGRLCEPLILLALKNDRRHASTDGYTYHFDASCMGERNTYRDEFGDRCSGFIDEYGPKRVADWLKQQMPGYPEEILNLDKSVTGNDQYLVTVWGYGGDNPNLKTTCMMRYGALNDFDIILRGMAAYQRKRRKQERKTLAQLRAYHQQQVLAKLRGGQWLGTDKALTTAARVDEPGVPFMGDVDLTPEQRKGLRYWAVPEDAGMSTHFPAGTGIALKVITSSKQLVDGAIYLSQLTLGQPNQPRPQDHVMRLGRLDLSKKTYGMIPLFKDDAPGKDLHIQAEWKHKEGQGYEVLLMQVTHYTTRSAEPVGEEAAVPLHQPQLRGQRRQRRELQAA